MLSEGFTNRYVFDPVLLPLNSETKRKVQFVSWCLSFLHRTGLTEIFLTCWCLNDIFFWDLNPFSGASFDSFRVELLGIPFSTNTLVLSLKTKKNLVCFSDIIKTFPKKNNDSGQIKCLAFRSFNEKKFWMNVMREIHWPRTLFRIRSTVQSQFFRLSQKIQPDKVQGQPAS